MDRKLFYILLLSCLLLCRAQIRIDRWDLDLNSGDLSFDIAGLSSVDITGLDCTKFYLQGSRAAAGATVPSVQLSGCESAVSASNTFSFLLLNEDLDRVKLATGIATQLSNTYLSVESGNGVTDGTDELQAYTQQEAVQASIYTVRFLFLSNIFLLCCGCRLTALPLLLSIEATLCST